MATPQLNGRTLKLANARIDKLADRISAPDSETKFSAWHVSAADMSTLAVALGVIYALIFK